MKLHLLFAVYIIATCFLSACNLGLPQTQPNNTISCNDIDDRELTQQLFEVTTTQEIENLLDELLGTPNIPIAESEFTENPSYSKIVQWEVNDKKYGLYFREEEVVRIHSNIELTGADVSSMLRCFGEPDYYYAVYQQDIESRVIVFSLWYLDEGMVVSTSKQSRNDTPPALDVTMIVKTVDYVQGNNLEDIVTDAILYGTDDEVRQRWLNNLKPWTQTWEELIVDNQVK